MVMASSTFRVTSFEVTGAHSSAPLTKEKHIFKKGYLPNFTEEIFTVSAKIDRNPPVYKLKDYDGEVITGIFYEPELVKVIKKDEIFLIEKILRKRQRNGQTEYLVKWQGYPKKFNQWINQSDLKTT